MVHYLMRSIFYGLNLCLLISCGDKKLDRDSKIVLSPLDVLRLKNETSRIENPEIEKYPNEMGEMIRIRISEIYPNKEYQLSKISVHRPFTRINDGDWVLDTNGYSVGVWLSMGGKTEIWNFSFSIENDNLNLDHESLQER